MIIRQDLAICLRKKINRDGKRRRRGRIHHLPEELVKTAHAQPKKQKARPEAA